MWLCNPKAILLVLSFVWAASLAREARVEAVGRAIRREVSTPLPRQWNNQQFLRARAEVQYLRRLEDELD
jgi:hypothetical protein